MANVVVAFAKDTDALNFKNILVRRGFNVAAVCNSGAQALSAMEDLGNGVIVCGYRLGDMISEELAADLPSYFQMLLIASPAKLEAIELTDNVISLQTPLQTDVLVSTLNMMLDGVSKKRRKAKDSVKSRRSDKELETIKKAKELLMDRHHMSEPEAHHYLQKCSMDSGTGIVEAAEMIISLNSI